MSEYIVDGSKLENIADAIRAKTGTTAGILLNNMPDEIMGIESPPANETYLEEVICNKKILLDYPVLGDKIRAVTVKLDHEPESFVIAAIKVTRGNLFPPETLSSHLQNGEFVFSQETEIQFELPEGRYHFSVEAESEETYPLTVKYATGLDRPISRSFSLTGFQRIGCITNGIAIQSITFAPGRYKNVCIFASDTEREYQAYKTPHVLNDFGEYEYDVPTPLYISDIDLTLDDSSILVETSERMYIKYYAYRDKKAYDKAISMSDVMLRHKFWDIFQECGNRTAYSNAFGKFWNNDTFRPYFDIIPDGAAYMFLRSPITDFNRVKNITIDFHNCTDCEGIFTHSQFVELPTLDFSSAVNLNYTFSGALSLKKIEKIIVRETTLFKDTFNACNSLEELTIEGTIGQSGFNVSWSTRLTKNSLLSILNALKTLPSNTTYTCTLGAINLAKLTQAEKNIAINKGWTLA